MMDYPPRHNANGHTWHHPDCELQRIVRTGGDEMTDMMRQMMAPPDAPKMQAFGDKLSNDEIDAVLAFIKTMWTPDEREVQAQIRSSAYRDAFELSSRWAVRPGDLQQALLETQPSVLPLCL